MKNNLFLKRIKRFIKICMIFLFIVFGVGSVSAREISTLSFEKMEGIYSYVKWPDSTRLFYLKIYHFNGKPAYCIELGEDINNQRYYNTTDYPSMGFTWKQINYVNLISYYGYEYPGHEDDYRYYMAAQELIWEYLEGIDVYWTTELNKDNPSKINIDKYLNEIKDLVSKHNLKPNIGNFFEYYVGDKIEIFDSNNRLSDYEIVSDGGLDASIEGNKILISNNGDKMGNYKIKLKQKVYSSGNGLIYYNDNSQKLYSMFGIKPYEIEFEIQINGASFVLNKYDSKTLDNMPSNGGSLSGAEYGLYDSSNQLVSVLTTDENGRAFVDGLTFGKYFIKEILPSFGYKLDENVYELVIDKVNNELIVYEDPDLKKIEIYKTYGDDLVPEENVSFNVMKNDGELYSTIVTDINGYGSIMVPYGGYIISQNNSLEGYLKVDDLKLEITQDSDDVITYSLNDVKIEVFQEESQVEHMVIENPKTFDGISRNIICFFISSISLIGIFVYILLNVCYNCYREEGSNE